jgi:hypothetical protein
VDPTPVFRHHDAVFLPDGTLLRTHPERACVGDHCCIHNPSDHPLRDAPQAWDPRLRAVYRTCEHGVVHPDYDDFAFRIRVGTSSALLALIGVHNCDGCCHWPTEDEDGVSERE